MVNLQEFVNHFPIEPDMDQLIHVHLHKRPWRIQDNDLAVLPGVNYGRQEHGLGGDSGRGRFSLVM